VPIETAVPLESNGANVRYDADAEVYVSYCAALNIYSQGETEDEARAALNSAIMFFLKYCHDHGTLNKVLNEMFSRHLTSS
jgi:predicted RNase H-like HicB family nuclease